MHTVTLGISSREKINKRVIEAFQGKKRQGGQVFILDRIL